MGLDESAPGPHLNRSVVSRCSFSYRCSCTQERVGAKGASPTISTLRRCAASILPRDIDLSSSMADDLSSIVHWDEWHGAGGALSTSSHLPALRMSLSSLPWRSGSGARHQPFFLLPLRRRRGISRFALAMFAVFLRGAVCWNNVMPLFIPVIGSIAPIGNTCRWSKYTASPCSGASHCP